LNYKREAEFFVCLYTIVHQSPPLPPPSPGHGQMSRKRRFPLVGVFSLSWVRVPMFCSPLIILPPLSHTPQTNPCTFKLHPFFMEIISNFDVLLSPPPRGWGGGVGNRGPVWSGTRNLGYTHHQQRPSLLLGLSP
jgi:hypothetical protein